MWGALRRSGRARCRKDLGHSRDAGDNVSLRFPGDAGSGPISAAVQSVSSSWARKSWSVPWMCSFRSFSTLRLSRSSQALNSA